MIVVDKKGRWKMKLEYFLDTNALGELRKGPGSCKCSEKGILDMTVGEILHIFGLGELK